MPNLRPVDYDPFENQPTAAEAPQARLRAVDYDPFVSEPLRHPDGRLTEAGWQAERDALVTRDPMEGTGLYGRYLAGVGSSLARGGRGLRQVLTEAAAVLPDSPMLPPKQVRQAERQRLRDQEAQIRRDEAPLRQSRAFQFGDFVGSGAQMLVPGAAAARTPMAGALLPTTVRGNALLGGAAGAAQPVATGENRLAGLAIGAGAGAAGGGLNRLAARWTPGAREAMGEADRLGINLRGTPGAQVQEISDAARGLVPGARGDAMPGIQDGVTAAREQARQGVTAAYDAAMATRATAPMSEVQGFAQGARRALTDQGFDLGSPEMAGVSRLLGQLDDFTATPGARAAQLRSLEAFRRRINAMDPSDRSPTSAASAALRNRYDDFMTDLFNRDMIAGDPTAIRAWTDARGASAKFHATFNANRVIRDLATKDDMTPEQMRGWLFNVSSAKAPSGAVVRRLNEILGPDSPQMEALRTEVVADVAEPLLKRTPDVKAFLDRYDTYFRRNPTLLRELFPDGTGDLQQVQMFARGIEKRPGAKIDPQSDPASRQMFGAIGRLLRARTVGHGIAEGGARMNLAAQLMARLEGATGVSWARDQSVGRAARRGIIRDYLGADPRQPMFQTGPGQAAIAAGMVEGPGLEIDIVGGTPVPASEFEAGDW